MIILSFPRSRSKNLDTALKVARLFESFHEDGPNLSITLQLKDVFERWELFNDLFWKVIDWSGTYIEYGGMRYYSHSDKTRIFYSLQQSHNNWICFTSYKLVNCYRIYTGESSLADIIAEYMTDEEINRIIDIYNFRKQNEELLRRESQ